MNLANTHSIPLRYWEEDTDALRTSLMQLLDPYSGWNRLLHERRPVDTRHFQLLAAHTDVPLEMKTAQQLAETHLRIRAMGRVIAGKFAVVRMRHMTAGCQEPSIVLSSMTIGLDAACSKMTAVAEMRLYCSCHQATTGPPSLIMHDITHFTQKMHSHFAQQQHYKFIE